MARHVARRVGAIRRRGSELGAPRRRPSINEPAPSRPVLRALLSNEIFRVSIKANRYARGERERHERDSTSELSDAFVSRVIIFSSLLATVTRREELALRLSALRPSRW